MALKQKDLNIQKIINAFHHYMQQETKSITRAMFEKNLMEKLQESEFKDDVVLLLSPTHPIPLNGWDLSDAAVEVKNKIIRLLPGKPWKGSDATRNS